MATVGLGREVSLLRTTKLISQLELGLPIVHKEIKSGLV